MSRNAKLASLIAAGSVLAASSGYLASVALTATDAVDPARTVTVNVATGPQGPPGPPGPPGQDGDFSCNPGFSYSEIVVNAPGGQEVIQVCLRDP